MRVLGLYVLYNWALSVRMFLVVEARRWRFPKPNVLFHAPVHPPSCWLVPHKECKSPRTKTSRPCPAFPGVCLMPWVEMGSHDPFPVPMAFTQWLGALPGQRREAEAGAGQVGPWVYRNTSAVQWQWMGPFPKLFFLILFFCIAAIRNTSGQKTKQSSFFFPFPSSQDTVTLLWEAKTSEKASCWNAFLINTAGCLPSSLKSSQPTAWHCAYVFLPGYIQTLAVLATKVFQVGLA